MGSRTASALLLASITCLLAVPPATAGGHREHRHHGDRHGRGERDPRTHGNRDPHRARSFRAIDGLGNNRANAEWGASDTRLLRLVPSAYADDRSSLAGPQRPGAREVSNAVADQPDLIENAYGTSDYLWQWGQFLDHDIDLTNAVVPAEPEPVTVPVGDPYFDPGGTGTESIPFNRSLYDPDTGLDVPREQINQITSYIDASNVYGSDPERAAALRTLDGSGRLKTSAGGLLPFNTEGLPNAGGPGSDLFLAGDVRANEQAALTAMHTLFVREHNRLVARYAERHPSWDGERLYQEARRWVGALVQVITVREFLPALLGPDPLPPYRGYDESVEAAVSNLFSTACYRFGHSALSPTLLRLDAHGDDIDLGPLPLRDAFFAPQRITDEGGIAPLLRGLAAQPHQSIDVLMVDDVRNFLFGPPGSGGFDLASLNIQRGRDHGLPSYNGVREALGLPRARDFADISSDPEIRERLASVYDGPDDVDAWIGGLAEDPLPGSQLGALNHGVLVEQFVALRDGDRHWYERSFSREEIRKLEATRLSNVIRRNTEIGRELQRNVFRVPRR